MFSKVLLFACVLAVAAADETEYSVMTCDNTTDAKVELKMAMCTVFTVGNMTYNMNLTEVNGNAGNGTLTGTVELFAESTCATAAGYSSLSCDCVGEDQFRFVCDGAAFALPSLLVLAASVLVYAL